MIRMLPVILFLTGSHSCTGQPPDSVAVWIRHIRSEFAIINARVPNFKVDTVDMPDESTEGGEMRKYFDGKVMRRVSIVFYGETGKALLDYYFKDGQLIFFFKQEMRYERPIGIGAVVKVKETLESRYYFHGGALIRWIDEKGKIEDQAGYVAKYREIMDQLRSELK